MNNLEMPPRSAHVRACKECQRRKSRCSGVTPCSFCYKAGRPCVFETPPSRTPLTRKNLDELERRCSGLESLLRTLNPDLDIEALLRDRWEQGDPAESIVSTPDPHAEQQMENPTPSNEYEWHESPLSPLLDPSQELTGSGDGMASLPPKPYGSGYLGSSSGSSLLETISALLPLTGSASPEKLPNRGQPASGNSQSLPSARKLMAEGNLASHAVTKRLIDAYFVLYNASYPILHERTFHDSYETRTSIPGKSSWHLVFYMVLAIGHWVLSTGPDLNDSPYYSAARSRMSTRMLESGTLGSVQAFLLMGNYLQKRDRPNTGYNLIGIAFRMALGLGLHREFPLRVAGEDTLAKERRRQVWWVLYCFDSGFSITTGRPTTTSDAFIDVKMPRNIEDSNSSLGDILAPPVGYPTTYSAIIAQAHLAVIANRLYNSTLSANTFNSEIDAQVTLDIEQQLLHWKASLPTYFTTDTVPTWFRGPRAVVLWKEQNLRIMLWRGGQRNSGSWSGKTDAARKCQLATIETIHDISAFCNRFWDLVHLGLNWYATYFLFLATLVLDMSLLQPNIQPVEDEMSSIRRNTVLEARECLSNLGQRNAAAKRCIAVLDRIHDHLATTMSEQVQREAVMPTTFYNGFTSQNTPEALGIDNTHWAFAADPALQGLFDDPTMTNLFDGLEGFPSTQEQEFFGYISGNLYNSEGVQNPLQWSNQHLG